MSALAGSWLLSWVSGAVRAVVLMKGWEWFVVPLGAPTLGFVMAWGLGLLVAFMTRQVDQPSEVADPWRVVLVGFGTSLLLSGGVFLSLLILAALR